MTASYHDVSIAPTVARTESTAKGWADAFVFRFAAVYWALCILPFPAGVPGTLWAAELYLEAQKWVVLRAASLLGQPPPSFEPTGSGDTLGAWIWLLCNLVLALVGASVWTAADRRPRSYVRGRALLRVALRYYLASSLLSYGLVKIIKVQFPFPGPSSLAVPYGQSSPQGMLWRFMGYSTPYNVFTGLAEVLGAVLLFHRKTTTLGALVIAGVMTNVVMLNFCYDVPVKIFSTHLLVMALVLAQPDATRLLNVLVLNRAAEPAKLDGPVRSRRTRIVLGVLKLAVVAACIGFPLSNAIEGYDKWGDGAPKPPLHGTYLLEVTKGNAADIPWRRVTIDQQGFVLFGASGAERSWMMQFDPTTEGVMVGDFEGRLQLTSPDGVGAQPDVVELEGHDASGAPLSIRLTRIPPENSVLVSRRFHWVQEVSYYR